jgi:acetyl-CoA carboxylase carboxyltransferase component
VQVFASLTGVIVEVLVGDGAAVQRGAAVLVVESMKMHHEVQAPADGVVCGLTVTIGDQIEAGQPLFTLQPRSSSMERPKQAGVQAGVHPSHVRPDLRQVLERQHAISDEGRQQAVRRRHELGRRTARENIAELCDGGSFVEYGGLALAAQRARRSLEQLIEKSPADGIVAGVGTINGRLFGEQDGRCVVLSYDYTVLAGTQGIRNHRKTDRMLDLARREQLPIVLFAEGGGGRPGDTDSSELFHLVVPTFQSFAALSGLVPRVGIVSGRCFAGNAALLGCCDVIIATPDASIGMGGPAMIEGGGLGAFAPEQVGPVDVQEPNGVIDVLVEDEAAAVRVAKRFLSYMQGSVSQWSCGDQRLLREAVPEDPKRVHDPRRLLDLLADADSVLELRRGFGRTILTALARVEGRPLGVIANDPSHLSGAIDAEGSDKAARFMQLCDAFSLPILSLVDTPGFMVGPDCERSAMVRRCSRLFVTGATLSVPLLCVVVRRAFGLGAQAMAGGHLHAPALTVAWPSGEFGAMGVEGAVKLALRSELQAIADPDERQRRIRELVAAVRAQSTALNMAVHFEIDDVIDPSDTRSRIVATLRSLLQAAAARRPRARRRTMIDTW